MANNNQQDPTTPARTGNLFVVSGPSGAGKGTLVACVLDQVSDAWLSVSATTRTPRPGEVDGREYHFVTKEHFEHLIQTDGLLEHACYAGNYYGSPAKPVRDHMAQNKQVILEIDYQGAMQIKQSMPQAHLVFIEPPSLEVLEQRLRNRATEDDTTIKKRLAVARVELLHKKEYDIRLVNDTVEAASQALINYINSCATKPCQ